MLQINFGLGQPFSSAHTPVRPISGSPNFINGQWVKIVGGLAVLAVIPQDNLCAEQIFNPIGKNLPKNVVTTIEGFYEGTTDQYVTASSYTDRCRLVIRNGQLDISASTIEDAYAVGICIGIPMNNSLRFKRIHNTTD